MTRTSQDLRGCWPVGHLRRTIQLADPEGKGSEGRMNAARTLLWLCRFMLAIVYVGLVLWLMACPLLWILRDGLGPDSVETTGWAALRKFSPVLLIGLVLVVDLALLHFFAWFL